MVRDRFHAGQFKSHLMELRPRGGPTVNRGSSGTDFKVLFLDSGQNPVHTTLHDINFLSLSFDPSPSSSDLTLIFFQCL